MCYLLNYACNAFETSINTSHNNAHTSQSVTPSGIYILVANPNIHIDNYDYSMYRTCVYYTETKTLDTNTSNTTNTDTVARIYCELNLERIILTIILSIYLSAVYIIICGLPRCIKTKELYKEQLDFL